MVSGRRCWNAMGIAAVCATLPAVTSGPSSSTIGYRASRFLHLMISLCPACHAKIHRTRVVIRLMPPLLLELWRELNPKGHEQKALNFSPARPPAKAMALFTAVNEASEILDPSKADCV